jgi:hypothetical protein
MYRYVPPPTGILNVELHVWNMSTGRDEKYPGQLTAGHVWSMSIQRDGKYTGLLTVD